IDRLRAGARREQPEENDEQQGRPAGAANQEALVDALLFDDAVHVAATDGLAFARSLAEFHDAHCPPPDSSCPEMDKRCAAVTAPTLSKTVVNAPLMPKKLQGMCQLSTRRSIAVRFRTFALGGRA